jgi:hypothetical protein
MRLPTPDTFFVMIYGPFVRFISFTKFCQRIIIMIVKTNIKKFLFFLKRKKRKVYFDI